MNTIITMDQIRKNRAEMLTNYKPPTTLAQNIKAWYEEQGVNRFPSYSMQFLVNTFGVAASKMGLALHELGWSRQRSFQKNKPFCRVWVPPTQNNETGCDL